MNIMKKSYIIIILCILQFVFSNTPQEQTMLPNGGVTIKTGIYNTAIKDEYISNEIFSDVYPFVTIGWTHLWSNGLFDMSISMGNTDKISNGNISSWYEHGSFNISLLYRLDKALKNKKNPILYIGPYIDYSSYYFSHTFSSMTRFESEGSLLSLGTKSKIVYFFSPRIGFELNIFSSLISIVEKTFDHQKYLNFEGNSQLSTIFKSGTFGEGLALRANLTKNIILTTEYNIIKARISEWDKYLEARDIISFEVMYDF